ncbi:RNA methyltransferase [Thiotrichales bacterium 19S3-7]|nr:RNA methyltransferase [Thiotrichales bacterium 19S3-7]MCF6802388.1 RNA methyltransferase [Thiotrichales bacterium 19S3-11]
MLEKIRIILVEPSHMGNIGSTARAMMNMGLTSLYLVNPKQMPDVESHQLASGASSVLSSAKVKQSLTDALDGVGLVIGTSARARKLSLPVIDVREAAKDACYYLSTTSHTEDEVAIIFGRERTGLYNDELLMCHKQLYIPTNEAYNSLNLAQAVQIIAYEMRMAMLNISNEQDLPKLPYIKKATQRQYEGFYEHLSQVLVASDFLDPNNPGLVMERMKRIFQRTQLEESEIHLLRGILKQILIQINS